MWFCLVKTNDGKEFSVQLIRHFGMGCKSYLFVLSSYGQLRYDENWTENNG
jgi:hypothetical protein